MLNYNHAQFYTTYPSHPFYVQSQQNTFGKKGLHVTEFTKKLSLSWTLIDSQDTTISRITLV